VLVLLGSCFFIVPYNKPQIVELTNTNVSISMVTLVTFAMVDVAVRMVIAKFAAIH